MDLDNIDVYKEQLKQIELALTTSVDGPEKDELLELKSSIQELLSLAGEHSACSNSDMSPCTSSTDHLDKEFELFKAEMEKEGALSQKSQTTKGKDYKDLEGMKCRAPYKHMWGHVAYHNAMVCAVEESTSEDDVKVKVLFTNPTHQEMLPCPYYFKSDCKFSDENCRFSHGETALYSELQEYVEPKFESLSTGSPVLAKKDNNLWYRGKIKELLDDKCMVKFESNQKDCDIVLLEHILPLLSEDDGSSDDASSGVEAEVEDDVINMSLLITPSEAAIGDWEKYTKGIGSKLMSKMGYVVGTGLGRRSDGRIDPVTAVILPTGKSLDYCMELREKAGGDKDIFNAEKKLKRLQRKQEIRNKKMYENEKNKVDVFNFINRTLSNSESSEKPINLSKTRQEIKNETCRNLNVASLQIDEGIRRAEREYEQIKNSLSRNVDTNSKVNKSLREKLIMKQNEIKSLRAQALKIQNEQSVRSDKKKMSVF